MCYCEHMFFLLLFELFAHTHVNECYFYACVACALITHTITFNKLISTLHTSTNTNLQIVFASKFIQMNQNKTLSTGVQCAKTKAKLCTLFCFPSRKICLYDSFVVRFWPKFPIRIYVRRICVAYWINKIHNFGFHKFGEKTKEHEKTLFCGIRIHTWNVDLMDTALVLLNCFEHFRYNIIIIFLLLFLHKIFTTTKNCGRRRFENGISLSSKSKSEKNSDEFANKQKIRSKVK